MFKAILAATILLASQYVYSDEAAVPFKATYKLSHKKDEVGKAVRQLEYLEDGNVRYSNKLDSKWFFFSDHRNEESILTLSENLVSPIHYTYSRTGTGKDKKYEWYYDTENHKAIDVKNKKITELEFPENFQDKLSYHLQLSLDLMTKPLQKEYSYAVIGSSGKISDTRYEVVGEEMLNVPYGAVETIKVKREVAEKKRVTFAWFAPKLNYALVKLTQFKKGKEDFDVKLSAIEFSSKKENKAKDSSSKSDNNLIKKRIEEKMSLEESTTKEDNG